MPADLPKERPAHPLSARSPGERRAEEVRIGPARLGQPWAAAFHRSVLFLHFEVHFHGQAWNPHCMFRSRQGASARPMSTSPDKQKIASPDYPSLARKLFEISEEIAPSKLPAGLYIVATPIGHLGDISLRALWTLAHAHGIACEDTRLSGAMLAKYGLKTPLLSYHDHNADRQRPLLLKRMAMGEGIALISDAGMPLIADPGYKLGLACRKAGHAVTVIPGANAAITALAGSGLPTDRFFFGGFLPPKTTARQKAIAGFKDIPATLLFYEAPQRLAATLADLAKILGAERKAVVARELTKFFEESRGGTLAELAEVYASRDVKGEITLVIGPGEGPVTSAHDLDDLLSEHIEQGASLRDAVAAVSTITGHRKQDVYERALKLAKKK